MKLLLALSIIILTAFGARADAVDEWLAASPTPVVTTTPHAVESASLSPIFGVLLATLEGLVAVVVVLGLYFLPTINAGMRHHKNQSAILLCNLFFGWSFIGWVIALIWSATANVTLETVK